MNSLLRLFHSLNRCDWYVILWCITQMEEVIHIEGGISQAIQALLLGWALYEGGAYMLPNRRLPLMLQATSILMFMYIVYGLVFIIEAPPYFSADPHYVYMKSFLISFLPIFLFYKYVKEGLLTEKKLTAYFYLFLTTIIAQYFHLASQAALKQNQEETTNNHGYLFLSLLPMAFFLYRNRLLQYAMVGLISLFVLLSMKRGAIAICAICFIWFLWDSIKNSTSVKHKYTTVLFGTVLVIGAFTAVSYMLATSDYFNQRIEQTEKGNSSGRDWIYADLMNAIVNDDSYTHLIFGRGAYATFDIVHKMAHNDWLETACNNGMIGISCLLIFLFGFYRTAVLVKRIAKPEYSSILLMIFFIFFARLFFSMSLQKMPYCITAVLAYFTYYTNQEDVNI